MQSAVHSAVHHCGLAWLAVLQIVIDTSRERYIGTSNRVIAGLLLFNQRGLPSACSNARFAAIGGGCKRGEAAWVWAATLGS